MTGGTLAETVSALRRDFPSVLLDHPGGDRLLQVAESLPVDLARRRIGFELRLAGPAGADLFAMVWPSAADSRAMLAWARRVGADQLAAAIDGWRSGFGWLAWNAEFLLLEFDAATEVRDLPCVWVLPRRASNEGRGADARANAFHADPNGLVAVLAALAGTQADETAAADLHGLLDALPPFAEIFAAGAMLSRDSALSPRVVVRRLRPEGLAELLDALDRQAAAKALEPLVRELDGLGTHFALNLDLGGKAPRVAGLEVHTGRPWTEGSPEGWPAVLEVLVAYGRADPERAEAAAVLPRGRRPGRPALGISHVKVVADGDDLLPAKVYLGVNGTHELLTAAAFRAADEHRPPVTAR